jgi:hypothetical protein
MLRSSDEYSDEYGYKFQSPEIFLYYRFLANTSFNIRKITMCWSYNILFVFGVKINKETELSVNCIQLAFGKLLWILRTFNLFSLNFGDRGFSKIMEMKVTFSHITKLVFCWPDIVLEGQNTCFVFGTPLSILDHNIAIKILNYAGEHICLYYFQ